MSLRRIQGSYVATNLLHHHLTLTRLILDQCNLTEQLSDAGRCRLYRLRRVRSCLTVFAYIACDRLLEVSHTTTEITEKRIQLTTDEGGLIGKGCTGITKKKEPEREIEIKARQGREEHKQGLGWQDFRLADFFSNAVPAESTPDAPSTALILSLSLFYSRLFLFR